jgi:hypothetical protein
MKKTDPQGKGAVLDRSDESRASRAAQLASQAQTATDEELGVRLISMWLEEEAKERGIGPEQLGQFIQEAGPRLIPKIAAQETESVENVALEKALRLACNGRLADAGAMFRAHMFHSAQRQVDRKFAEKELRRLGQLSKTRAAGAASRAHSEEERAAWRAIAAEPDMARHSTRARANIIATRRGLEPGVAETIRKAIAKKSG